MGYILWVPVQNENVGLLFQKLLRISRQRNRALKLGDGWGERVEWGVRGPKPLQEQLACLLAHPAPFLSVWHFVHPVSFV